MQPNLRQMHFYEPLCAALMTIEYLTQIAHKLFNAKNAFSKSNINVQKVTDGVVNLLIKPYVKLTKRQNHALLINDCFTVLTEEAKYRLHE